MTTQAKRPRLRLVTGQAREPGPERAASSVSGEPPADELAERVAVARPADDAAPFEPPPVSRAGRVALAGLPDEQLVALALAGEARALEALYVRHAAFAINLAARIEGSSRDVEDIVHDAFLKAYERLAELADRSAFRAWLGAIVVHKVRSRMRRARLMSLLGFGRGAEPIDLDAIASPDASPHVRAQIAQVYALLQMLPTDDRIAWTLRAVDGHDLETVARLTSCSLATVKRRIARAQKFLDEHFVDPHAPEAPGRPEGVRPSAEAQGDARARRPCASSGSEGVRPSAEAQGERGADDDPALDPTAPSPSPPRKGRETAS